MLGIVKALVLSLLGGFAISIPSLVWRVVGSLGMGFIVYQGGQELLDRLKSLLNSQMMGLDSPYIGIMGLMKIDDAIGVVISAYTVSLIIKYGRGAFRKIGFKSQGGNP